MLSRRSMIKSSAMAPMMLTLVSAFMTQGCQLMDEILRYVGVASQGLMSVISILAGAGIVSTPAGLAISVIVAAIKAALTDVSAAVTEYDNAPPANKDSLKAKISLALHAAEDQITAFWNDLQIPDAKLASLIQGLLGIIVSTLAGFATGLPAPVATRKAFPKTLGAVPKKRNAKEFVKDFNAKLQEGGFSQYSLK